MIDESFEWRLLLKIDLASSRFACFSIILKVPKAY